MNSSISIIGQKCTIWLIYCKDMSKKHEIEYFLAIFECPDYFHKNGFQGVWPTVPRTTFHGIF